MASDRELDLVLLGATGFTGGLVAEDLTRQLAGTGTAWAIAGRDPGKLEGVAERLAAVDADGAPSTTLVADSHEIVGLLELTQRTRALATTVGPFARHGELAVQACVRTGTDYADITGEPEFVDRILTRYDGDARERGVRVVNCCGFDSIPHDLGAQLAVEQLPDDAPVELRGYVSAAGRFSGGTFLSAIEAMGDPASMRSARPDPGAGRKVSSLPRRIEHVDAISGWAVPLPTIDPWIVLRSAAALPTYGPEFRYGHFARVARLPTALGLAAGAGVGAAVARSAPGRSLLSRFAPEPGDGPDEATRAAGRFRVVMLGEGGGQQVRVEVRGGDPGYTETSKMLAESVRSLVEDRDRLPDAAGVLTPAVAFGDVLRGRLDARGITFEVAAA